MTDTKKTKDYEVGYGKPPKDTQFKPGQSGNPKGRPKKQVRYFSYNQLAEDFIGSLEQEVTVTRNGKRTRGPIIYLIFDQLALGAANGDARSIKLVVDLLKFVNEKQEKSVDSLMATVFEIDKGFTDQADANPGLAEEILWDRAKFRTSPEVLQAFAHLTRVMPKRGPLTEAEERVQRQSETPWDPNDLPSWAPGKQKKR